MATAKSTLESLPKAATTDPLDLLRRPLGWPYPNHCQPERTCDPTLADAKFWREREDEFRRHDTEDNRSLRAEWFSVGEKWRFRGGKGRESEQIFVALALEAAKGFAGSTGVDSWKTWLNVMRQEGWGFKVTTEGTFQFSQDGWETETGMPLPSDCEPVTDRLPNGETITRYRIKAITGEIERVFKLSADYCIKLRSRVAINISEPKGAEQRPVADGNPSIVDYVNAKPMIGSRTGQVTKVRKKVKAQETATGWNELSQPAVGARSGRTSRVSIRPVAKDTKYPKFMHHRTKPPVQVFSKQEQVELGSEWSEEYIHQEYPKVKYHWIKPTVTVNSAEEEKALGAGWGNTPATFDPYKNARLARTGRQDPVKWVDEWSVPGLSSEHRKKIRTQLLRADGAFERLSDPDSAAVASMRQAFDGVAEVLFQAGILTEDLLQDNIPQLVWDSAIAGGWWRFASESREDIFPERLGHYWVWRGGSKDWGSLFRAESAEWQAQLLEISIRPFELAEPQPHAPELPEQPVCRRDLIPHWTLSTHRRGSATSDRLEGDRSVPSSREGRLQAFIRANPGTTLADIKHSARVHTPDFQNWRGGDLKPESVMSGRIEDVLSGNAHLKKKPRKRRRD